MKSLTSYNFIRIMRLIVGSSIKWTLANAALVVICGLIPLAQLWAVKIIIDIASDQITTHAFDLQETLKGLILMGIILVANTIFSSIHTIVKQKHSFKVSMLIADIIHSKTTSINYGFFEDANYHNVFFRAVAESQSKPQGVFYNIIGLIQELLTLISLAAILISIHWSLPLIVLCLGLPIVAIRTYFSRKFYRLQREQTIDERRAQYYNRVLTAREFAKEVRMFDLAAYFRNLYCSTRQTLQNKLVKLLVSDAISEGIVRTLASAAFVAVFGIVIYQAVIGHMSVGLIAMYLMALQRCYNTAQDVLQRFASLYDSNLFLKNFFEFIDMPSAEKKQPKAAPSTSNNAIEFTNVSFSYPNTERIVLKDISFKVEKGESLAIVGCNGCGKSTIIKLICGLYEPTEGKVAVNGKISAIFQDFMLYNATALNNIRFGNIYKPDASDAAIKLAARDAGADKIFESMPNSYDTMLGNLTPDSEMLSSGEWQRVALARSFYADSNIIVMDEPTSALDAFTEASLIDKFKMITIGRTAIIVSHRITSIRMASKIMVVDNHGIAGMGTYEELMQSCDLFRRMIESLEK
ncbi:MAG: ABC transporter ATP-binding protein/permease [Bacteroidales bacterium]|nr:ABC transporter ATP-binding protein/permease [Bacteroidales bacterium]